MTIERNDVNENYEPNNCCWKTKLEQAHNKRNNNNIEIKGEVHCITEWSRLLKKPQTTLRRMCFEDWINLYDSYYSDMKLKEMEEI